MKGCQTGGEGRDEKFLNQQAKMVNVCFPRSLVRISFYVVMCIGRSLPFQSVISPVVRRVNITGNRFRVGAQQLLLP